MRTAIPLVVLLFGLSASMGAAETTRMLTDFDRRAADLQWFTVNDNVMGGRSEGGFRIDDGVLVFAGSTNTNGGGFSSIRTEAQTLGLGDAEGLTLRVRGDGRTYTFSVRTNARYRRSAVSYQTTFPTTKSGAWEEVRVRFDDFVARWRGQRLAGPDLDRAKIDGLGIMIYDKRDGPFRLEVDWIRADRPAPSFSMSTYRDTNRPLVLFAPSANDLRLREQMEGLVASRDEAADRDMLVVVVLAKGASMAGDRELSAAEADALRKRYDVADDAFALRLVGKDGSVKRSSDEPVSMQSIYDLIDSMPMRQAERRERG